MRKAQPYNSTGRTCHAREGSITAHETRVVHMGGARLGRQGPMTLSSAPTAASRQPPAASRVQAVAYPTRQPGASYGVSYRVAHRCARALADVVVAWLQHQRDRGVELPQRLVERGHLCACVRCAGVRCAWARAVGVGVDVHGVRGRRACAWACACAWAWASSREERSRPAPRRRARSAGTAMRW